jgi:hypothetical protein
MFGHNSGTPGAISTTFVINIIKYNCKYDPIAFCGKNLYILLYTLVSSINFNSVPESGRIR